MWLWWRIISITSNWLQWAKVQNKCSNLPPSYFKFNCILLLDVQLFVPTCEHDCHEFSCRMIVFEILHNCGKARTLSFNSDKLLPGGFRIEYQRLNFNGMAGHDYQYSSIWRHSPWAYFCWLLFSFKNNKIAYGYFPQLVSLASPQHTHTKQSSIIATL